MLTLDDEVEMTLSNLAKQEHLSPNEMIKRLISCYVSQNQTQQPTEIQSQLEIGREFMREYQETFRELAK